MIKFVTEKILALSFRVALLTTSLFFSVTVLAEVETVSNQKPVDSLSVCPLSLEQELQQFQKNILQHLDFSEHSILKEENISTATAYLKKHGHLPLAVWQVVLTRLGWFWGDQNQDQKMRAAIFDLKIVQEALRANLALTDPVHQYVQPTFLFGANDKSMTMKEATLKSMIHVIENSVYIRVNGHIVQTPRHPSFIVALEIMRRYDPHGDITIPIEKRVSVEGSSRGVRKNIKFSVLTLIHIYQMVKGEDYLKTLKTKLKIGNRES